jgi:hypothetical protein
MAERKENSVLFSLNELRSIEEERQQEAVDSRRRAEEDRVRSQMEAERRAREEAEAKRRAIEDAERNQREAIERAQREDRVRIEEAERRARVEAQAQLEQQRMSQEMQLRAMEAQKKRPTGLIAVAAILVIAVVGLGVFLYQRSQEAEKKEREYAAYRAEVDAKTAEINKLVEEQSALIDKLGAAGADLAKQEEAKRELAAKQAEINAKKQALEKLKASGKSSGGGKKSDDEGKKKPGAVGGEKCDPNDPLCGM